MPASFNWQHVQKTGLAGRKPVRWQPYTEVHCKHCPIALPDCSLVCEGHVRVVFPAERHFLTRKVRLKVPFPLGRAPRRPAQVGHDNAHWCMRGGRGNFTKPNLTDKLAWPRHLLAP